MKIKNEGVGCIKSFFGTMGKMESTCVGLMEMHTGRSLGWDRQSIHTLERHGLESDIFVFINNQGT